MIDFRKWFPALAVAALALGAASTANAQQVAAFSCVGNAGVPPIVRAEGLTELVGDLVLNCSGGTPTAAGSLVPQANIQIFLNTNVTSRWSASSDSFSEALLMIDEPQPGAQRYCSQSDGASCAIPGVGTGDPAGDGIDGVDYDQAGSTGYANVFQGRRTGANSVVWLGVPVDPPGTSRTRVIRITNVRANANQLGTSSTLIPTQIVMFVSVTGTTSVPINNPQQTVAFIQPGLSFSTRQAVSTYLQCVSFNKDAATDSAKALSSGLGTVVRFGEGFASSFKRRNVAGYTGGDSVPSPVSQNTPGAIYNTETGFYNSAPVMASLPAVTTGTPPATTTTPTTGSVANLDKVGLADHGTRLMARLANVPAGVVVYATVYPVGSCSDCATGSKAAVTSIQSSGSAKARLITTDTSGGGAFSAVSATNNSYLYSGGSQVDSGAKNAAPVSLNNGAGMAVWEILDANPLASETFEFGLAVSYASNTSNNLPGLGAATVAGSFAPLSTVTTGSTSAPIPRFADTSTAATVFTINPCTTNLLFVFLTNQAGFDSGIVISNTSVDPFGTTPQSGPCKLNYYGETTGGGAAPAAQTSATVPAGKQLTAVLSTGGNYGIAATPGFQGYVIAQCSFQYAHGFAFISDVGASRLAESYTALVLDKALADSRTVFSSEVLGH